MSYTVQRYLAIAVAVILGVIGAIQIGNAETLGITPQISAWLAVASAGLGILAGFLPNVRDTEHDPETIADRIGELSDSDRQVLLTELEQRHGKAA